MDMRSWKKVLLQWITECGFTERNYFNIEQSDIDAFYQSFTFKHQKTVTGKYKTLGDFLKEFYPSFEINFDDENCLSSADYIYVYSLLLHFCCVKYPETAFHEICQHLPENAQQYIAAFFKELLDTEPITKEALRHAIAEVANIQGTPPRLNESFSSSVTSVSVGGISSRCESPLKTPKRLVRPLRISPSTPKSFLLEERTKELYNLRALLETERYEKGLLEVQIKQNEEKIQKLNRDHKRLLQQLQDLKNDILVKTNDGCTNHSDEENQIQKRILKELSQKEEEIIKLTDNVRTLGEEKALVEEKRMYAEKQICLCMDRLKELDFKIDELKNELEKKDNQIRYLTDSKLELEQFISDTRSSLPGVNADLNTSADTSNSMGSPENLGVSVIDVQLREKERENQLLKEELQYVKQEHKRLAKHLTKLTQEFDLPIDSSSPVSSEDSDADNEKYNGSWEESSPDEQMSCDEHFNIFNSCIEKIDKFHKTEKNKFKQLEQQSSSLQQKNEDLTGKLNNLKSEVCNLHEKLSVKEELLKVLEESKKSTDLELQKYQNNLAMVEKKNNKLYEQVQSLEYDKETLNKNILELKSQLELQQNECKDLLVNNRKLNENEQNLHKQLQDIHKILSTKTIQWEQELKHMSEKIAEQIEDIDGYKKTEQTIKCKYEQVVVQNEELKKEARSANKHLSEIRTELTEKEKQLFSLGKDISIFKEKNLQLEHNINSLIEKQHQEKLISISVQEELEGELHKLKEQIAKTELLMDSKQHECELKQQRQEDLQTEVHKLLKLFGDFPSNEEIFTIINILENEIEKMFKANQDLQATVLNLEDSHREILSKTQELTLDLQEKSKTYEKAHEEILSLKEQNLLNEKLVENLQQEKAAVLEKATHELKQKEEELQDRLREAFAEYEASLERITVELKLEKEHHSNKEIELLLSMAEHNEVKKKLSEAEQRIQNLQDDKEKLQQSCERLKQFENKVTVCTEENERLRQEIEAFKQQVTQNALRLLEADKALTEFMELTKEQDTKKSEIETLIAKLKVKEITIEEMTQKVKQQSINEAQLTHEREEQKELLENLEEKLQKLQKDKERLTKESEQRSQQISKEHKEKLLLLASLEKSTDQLKFAAEERQQEKEALEQKLQDLKQQFDCLTVQNTRLQGDLVEREAELRLSLDEQEQKREDFQQKLALHLQKTSEKSDQLEAIDVSLMEIAALMENNFNLSQELQEKLGKNAFNYQNSQGEENLQKLRKYLNEILLQQQELKQQLAQVLEEKEGALGSLSALRKSNSDLLSKLEQQEKTIKELNEELQNEELIVENRVFHEVKRLEGDLLNLEKVNERLANENITIQMTLSKIENDFKDVKEKSEALEDELLQLKEELRAKSVIMEKLQQEEKKLQQTLKEKQQQTEKLLEKCKHLEVQIKDKTLKLHNLEKEHQDLKEKANRNQQKLTYNQQSQQNQQAEHKKMQEKLKLLQITNDSLEVDVGTKKKELLAEKNKNSELLQKNKSLEQQLNMTSMKLDEMLSNKLNAETKCEQLQSEVQQLKRDLEFFKSQQHSHQEDSARLTQEIESLKIDKQHLRDEIHENKLSLQRANDNVTQLIQQISSIRLEKEAALEENLLLRKQLEETGKNKSSSETKMKSIIEKSQDFERKLLSAENELKSLKANIEKSENNSQKLQSENKKLRDSQEASTKRIEKLALKLGDTQARSAKLERDNEKLSITLESHSSTVEALQKEKDLLQAEAKSLKERLSRAERGHEQLAAKVQNLEHLNTNLQQIKQKLEASEIDGKTKLHKLEKIREMNEEKIRKLLNSLNNTENANVKLNLEIGALNSQLHTVKVEHNQEQSQQIEKLNQKLTETQELYQKYQDLNEKLKIELDSVKEENSTLNDKLSKASLSLQMTSQKCERFASEMEQIRAEMLIMRQEKSQVELEHETSIQKLNQFESQNTKLVYERKNLVKSLEQRISHLEEELESKTKKVVELQKEIETHASLLHQNTADNLTELDDLRTKLSLAEELRQKEQQIISQLRLDNTILHTKYQESKQRVLDATITSEERIKENRLELEGKLEKMKNKMKTLYTEEITKMKTKQEREMAIVKSEKEVLKAQNTKYEEHTRKLSNQIVRLNDNILQHQKENTMLSTKLKHIMDQLQDSERNKRPNTIHVSTISSSTASVAGPNIGTNLAMEDEEGEVFNNTYLTDLKNGRISELMSRDVCVEELKYRNSLLPPHLRSTYAAQFDHEFPEDDLKDGPHSLDDSMSALLSSTANSKPKKCTGVTHYKRPGPPTPSKNGGRLSFGSSSEPAREILKESYDTNAGSAVTTSKTPARFNFFSSRFSMGTTKDEKPNIRKWSKELDLRKAIHKPNIKGDTRRILSGMVCTSTPRKSKVHFDQRRLLDQFMSSSPSPSPLVVGYNVVKVEKKITPPDDNIVETPVTTLDRQAPVPKASSHKMKTKRIEAIAGGLKRSRRNSVMFGRRLSRRLQEICTPTSTSSALSTPAIAKDKIKRQVVVSSTMSTSEGVTKSAVLRRRLRKKPKRQKGDRPSMYIRGNIFVKSRTPNKCALRDFNRFKSRKQRLDHFNVARNLKSFKIETLEDKSDKTISSKTMKNITYDLKNNNYASLNNNKKAKGDTIVIAKCQTNDQERQKETFTLVEKELERECSDNLDYISNYEMEEEYNDDCEEETDSDKSNAEIDNAVSKKQTNVKYNNLIEREYCQQNLVTSQDLDDFDRFIANINKISVENEHDDDTCSSQGSSKHFEQILVETESNAPFEVKDMHFNFSKSSRISKSSFSHCSSSMSSIHSHSSTNLHSHSQDNGDDHTTLSTATPHHSPNNPNCNLSRTIYGGMVIYNHRLPNINTTFVRKSSIYVKNRKRTSNPLHNLESSSCNDVVLITNQTITFVDIMRMWSQMDSSTRFIVSFAILASFTTLFGLFVSLCSRR